MSDLAKELSEELKRNNAGLSWFQRASIIVFANVVGLVLGAIIIAAGGIIWTKAMSTDAISDAMTDGDAALRAEFLKRQDDARTERDYVLDELSTMQAQHVKFLELVSSHHAETLTLADGEEYKDVPKETEGDIEAPDVPPAPTPDSPAQRQLDPSAADVRDARKKIDAKIDEKVYRAKHLRE